MDGMNEIMVSIIRDEWETLVELRARAGILYRMTNGRQYIDCETIANIFGFEYDKEAE